MEKRNPVYREMSESTYSLIVGNYEFFFSRKVYLNNFTKNLETRTHTLKKKLETLYLIDVDFDLYFQFICYRESEKNGVYIVDLKTNEVITCLKSLKFVGVIKTLKNSNEE